MNAEGAGGLKLNPDQAAAVALRGRSVLVSAAAGAGKTRVLVERLIAYLLEDGCSVDEFLLITFTRAAAGEMRARIYKRLRDLERARPGDARIREQLRRLPAARICTLDAYCQEIVSENAAFLGMPGGFRVPDDARNKALRERVMEETLDTLYEEYAAQPDAPFIRCAEAYGDARGDWALKEMALELWEKTRAHPRPFDWLEEGLGKLTKPDAPWTEVLLEGDRARLRHIRDLYDEILPLLYEGGYGESYVLSHRKDLESIDALLAALEDGYEAAGALLPTLSKDRLIAPKRGKDVIPPDTETGDAFKEIREKWGSLLKKLGERYAYSPEDCAGDLHLAASQLRGLEELLRRFDAALWQEKLRLRCPDFADIRYKALELLCPDGRPGVYAAQYGHRFREIMVDEYQDINALQNLLIDALSREGQNVFYVGDVRQSIYRFQLAEPALFRQKFETFRPYNEGDLHGGTSSGEALRVILRENYRSHPAILGAVNRCFSRIDCPEMGALSPESFLRSGGEVEGEDRPARDGGGAVEWLSDSEDEERAVAARLLALCASGAYRPSDCVILLRSPASKLAGYRKALEEVGLGCLAPGGERYLDRPEILQLRAALRVLRNARDDAALVALLRGPLLSLDPDGLAALRRLDSGAICDCLKLSDDPKIKDFRRMLARWRDLSADLPPYELCAEIMADSRLPGLYEGAARENLLLFPELLRAYHGRDLESLEDWLGRQESMSAAPPRTGAADTGAVRLMSIHQSKGLEFPVVVLAGLGKRWNTEDEKRRLLVHPHLGLGARCHEELCHYPTLSYHAVAERLQSEGRSEELRLLYVAMTRAVDKLILSGADGQKPLSMRGRVSHGAFLDASCMGAWLATLRDPAWQEAPAADTSPLVQDSREEAGTPPPPPFSLAPYPYREATRSPAKMTATGIKERFGVKADKRHYSLSAGEGGQTLAAKLNEAKAARVFLPRMPRFDGKEPPLTPAERGTALHKFMQFACYEHCGSSAEIKEELGRLEAQALLRPAEAKAVDPDTVARFFAGDTGKRLRGNPSLRREQRFSLLVEDGDLPGLSLPPGEQVLLQGVVDCYFVRPDGKLCVLDFKTDAVGKKGARLRARSHALQLEVYAAALERMTGLRVAERLLCFLAADVCVEL